MTVTGETGVKVSGSANTAAMEAAPDFGGGTPPVPVYSPAPAHAHGAHGGHGVPPTAPGVVAAVPAAPAPTRGGQGGGKGLIIGLGAVGVLLLAAMAVVAAKSLKPDSNDTLIIPGTTDASTGSTVIAPLIDAGSDTTPVPTETSATPDPADAASTATTPTTRPTTTRPTPSASSTTKPSSGGGAACDACIASANSGDAAGAAANFNKCGDETKKAECRKAVNRTAANVASAAAKNGQCQQARAIITAAKQMGATSKKLDTALDGSSCK